MEERPRGPQGGLDQLAELIDTAETAGLRVELDIDGEPRPLPVPVDLAAYRIIQEALTNVLRHATARTVHLALKHEPSRLLIRIRDDGHREQHSGRARLRHRRDAGARPRVVRSAHRSPAPRRRLRGAR